jgi:HAE1 family hydrophobic/amphiphilic exporter-1
MMASLYLKPKTAVALAGSGGRSRGFWRRMGDAWERGYRRVEELYRRLLGWALRWRKTVLALALVLFAISLYMTKFMGKELHPPEDQGQFIVRLEAPIDYSLGKADEMFREAERIVRGLPEVRGVFYAQGFGAGGVGPVNKAIMFTTLIPKAERDRSQEDIKAVIRTRLNEIPGLKGTAEDVSVIGGGIRNVPIQYVISGGDLGALQGYAKQITREFARLPGIVDVDTSLEEGKPELKVFIDRDKAADLGVSVAGIAEAVNILVSGEVEITRFKDEKKGRRYDVRVQLDSEDRRDPSDLGRIYVRARDGRLVQLANVVQVQEGGGPSIIYRVDRQRAIMVYASLEGKPLGRAMEELDAISARVLPADFTAKYKGAADTMKESFGYLMFALFLGILMAYMILAAQFESLLHPVTVLLSMPLSFIGAFGALILTGRSLNIFTFIGLILLMGLVKKNAILLVDYTNTLRERGLGRQEAILQAGPVRLRPILMTTFAMIFGMMPVAFALGEGAETRSPMGIAVIGGLVTSLFLTLVVVPAAYDQFDDWRLGLRRRLRRRRAGAAPERREGETR